ncbi:MAG TPA: hypothetical protein VMQ44_03715 [Candidatus Saccharimonadales bacterium]|nr:hypothetical protein [Candidatus Saccharimonadales bacterium]
MKLENIIGIGLLVLAIFGFILSLLLGLPSSDKVNQTAQPLQNLPEDFFASTNQLNTTIGQLKVPSGVPVTADPNNLGRSNVFASF